jgi:hypothetical protein
MSVSYYLYIHIFILTATIFNIVQQNSTYPDAGYPDRLGPSGKFVENLQINLPRNYRLSVLMQYIVMASRTSNQKWSKGLDADTYCK